MKNKIIQTVLLATVLILPATVEAMEEDNINWTKLVKILDKVAKNSDDAQKLMKVYDRRSEYLDEMEGKNLPPDPEKLKALNKQASEASKASGKRQEKLRNIVSQLNNQIKDHPASWTAWAEKNKNKLATLRQLHVYFPSSATGG